jgi:hypothetical protein
MQHCDLKPFIEHSTLGLREFEHRLHLNQWGTLPDHLQSTFGQLVKDEIQPDRLKWCRLYEQAKQYKPGENTEQKRNADQDLRTATVSILRALYEFGPIACRLSQVLQFIASKTEDLKSNLHVGYNERGLVDATRDYTFEQYMTTGYKGTGNESVNLICMLTDSELTCLLTSQEPPSNMIMPQAVPKQTMYEMLRSIIENPDTIGDFVKKWETFCPYLPFVKDVEGQSRPRTHLFVPSSGQNRLNAASRVLEADPERFILMERWTMTFWSNMPRIASDYLSKETQDRDSCSQAIYDAEVIKKTLQDRHRLIRWDDKYVRWSLLSEGEQQR